jgi:hypothetical protein
VLCGELPYVQSVERLCPTIWNLYRCMNQSKKAHT